MKAIRIGAIVLAVYVGIVIGFELLVGFMGSRQAASGVEPGSVYVVITTKDASGRASDTVIAGVEREGKLYVSANHWPRGWYERAIANPDVEIKVGDKTTAYRAVPVEGAEREWILERYNLPWPIRVLSGFPPRSFLRLDPRSS